MDPFNEIPKSPITNPVVWPDSDEENDPDHYPQSQSPQQLLHHPQPQSPGHSERPTNPNNKRRAEKWEWSPSSSHSSNRRRCDLKKPPKFQLQDISNIIIKTKIDRAIEEGADCVDFSNLGLSEIPPEIGELQHIVVLSQDRIKKSSLNLLLYSNALRSLCPELFQLQNLSMLSLRNNNLTVLPPEIGFLTNLVEISLENNELQYLPSEILNLRKLNRIGLATNPLRAPICSTFNTADPIDLNSTNTQNSNLAPSSLDISPQPTPLRQILHTFSPLSLAELASRRILADSMPYAKDELPDLLATRLRQAERANMCPNPRCQKRFVVPEVKELIWIRLLQIDNVPLLFRWCSSACGESTGLEQVWGGRMYVQDVDSVVVNVATMTMEQSIF